jgi:spermidine synthase
VVETLERTVGHSGELVLRRRRGRLELICGGVFVISEENEESSRALVRAALPQLPARPLDVLIGGLGFGYALDEALATERVRSVTVAELEPAILSWFERYGAGRASRCAADARARILVADVVEVLHERPKSCDLLVLDTDNGPDWLVREANAVLYAEDGVRLAHRAQRVSLSSGRRLLRLRSRCYCGERSPQSAWSRQPTWSTVGGASTRCMSAAAAFGPRRARNPRKTHTARVR